MSEYEFGFLGGGQMATAIAKGVVKAGISEDAGIAFYEPNTQQVEKLSKQFPKARMISRVRID